MNVPPWAPYSLPATVQPLTLEPAATPASGGNSTHPSPSARQFRLLLNGLATSELGRMFRRIHGGSCGWHTLGTFLEKRYGFTNPRRGVITRSRCTTRATVNKSQPLREQVTQIASDRDGRSDRSSHAPKTFHQVTTVPRMVKPSASSRASSPTRRAMRSERSP